MLRLFFYEYWYGFRGRLEECVFLFFTFSRTGNIKLSIGDSITWIAHHCNKLICPLSPVMLHSSPLRFESDASGSTNFVSASNSYKYGQTKTAMFYLWILVLVHYDDKMRNPKLKF